MNIEVYSDGSGMTKQTPAGYGYVVVFNGCKIYEGSGHIPFGTNNDAELMAAIEGLDSLNSFCANADISPDDIFLSKIYLVSDSQIILNWVNGTNKFKQIDKIDKYDKLMKLMKKYNVKTRWVPGHSGDEFNERCDRLANAARKNEIIL